jgi:NAD(P)H-dependent FMN reductase
MSVSTLATSNAQQHLRNVLDYVNVSALGLPEAFTQMKDGMLNNACTVAMLTLRNSCEAG